MCNRIALPSTQQLKERYPHLNVCDIQPSYHSNGYEHELVPIITNLHPSDVQLARWGFLPENANSPHDLSNYETLNARCETIFDSQLYGESARTKRCVLFVNGFFEFKHYKNKKYPHFIAKESGETFTFGGLWSDWKGTLTCTIVTTPANDLMADIHNVKRRMPFILPEEEWAQWLDITQPEQAIRDMMLPYSNEDLVAWQVGSTLTQREADKNTPEIQAPIGPGFSKAPYPLPVPLPEKPASTEKRKKQEPPSPQLGLF